MVRILKYAARQAHYVPDRPHTPCGPFPPELLASPKVVDDYIPQPDGGGDIVEGTAQNGYRPSKIFRCKTCHSIVLETELNDHECFEENDV